MNSEDIAKAIGNLEGQLKVFMVTQATYHKEHRESISTLGKKMEQLHGDLNRIKVFNAVQNVRISGLTGLISAVGTLGLIEGIKFWSKG